MPRPEVEPQLEGEHLQHNPWVEVELLALLPLGFDPDHHDNHDADGEKADYVCVDDNRVKLTQTLLLSNWGQHVFKQQLCTNRVKMKR